MFMRSLYSLITIFILFSWTTKINSQCTSPVLTSQEMVNNFPQNCTSVTGDLFVNGLFNDISDLSPLANVESVSGRLILNGITVQNLDQLVNIKTVGEEIQVAGDYILNIDKLLAIDNFNGEVILINCPLLTNVDGLSNIVTPSIVKLLNLSALSNIDGISSVENYDELELKNLPSLTDFSVLEDVDTINFLDLNNVPITDLTVFENVFLNGLRITDLNVSSFNGINKNLEYENAFSVNNCPLISDFTTLELTKVAQFAIWGSSFQNFVGCPIKEIASFSIAQNAFLENIDGLENVKITGTTANPLFSHSLTIGNNPLLNDLSAMDTWELILPLNGPGAADIIECPNLSICNYDLICHLINLDPLNSVVYGNAQGLSLIHISEPTRPY